MKTTALSIEKTIKSIHHDISNGKKLKAIDRLKNLINTYPEKIELRERLAELYYEDDFLDAAGKYWYLSILNEERKVNAVRIYKETVKNSSLQILKDIGYSKSLSHLPEHAQKRLSSLAKDSKMRHGYDPNFGLSEKKQKSRQGSTFISKIGSKFVGLLALFILFLIILGVLKLLEWIF